MTSRGGHDVPAFPHSGLTEFRRRVEVVHPSPGTVEAEIEDNFHHFRVSFAVTDGVITGVRTTGVRTPWTTCSTGAAGALSLEGLALDVAQTQAAQTWRSDPSKHCTHTADVAYLAVNHALDLQPLRYEVLVRPPESEQREAWLFRDGHQVFHWHLDGPHARGPAPFDSRVDVYSGSFGRWAREHLSADELEAAMVLRRGCHVARGATYDFDATSVASDLHNADNSCFSYRVEIAGTAKRRVGNTIQITSGPHPAA